MSDYSDLLYLIGAMVIFSLLSMNVSAMFRTSNISLMQSEIEYNAISVLQDEIEVIRWLGNDQRAKIDSTLNGGSEYLYDDPVTKTVNINGDDIEYILTANYETVNFSDLPAISSYRITLSVENQYLPEGNRISQMVVKNFPN